jgi:hypothetical protein
MTSAKSFTFERSQPSGSFELNDAGNFLPSQDRPRIQEILKARYEDLHRLDGRSIELDASRNAKPRVYTLRVRMLGGHRPDFEFSIEREPEQAPAALGEPEDQDWVSPFFRQIDHRFGLYDEGTDSVQSSPEIRYLEPILADMRAAAEEDPDRFVVVLVMGFAFLRFYQAIRDPGAREATAIEVLDRILHGEAARFDRAAFGEAQSPAQPQFGLKAVFISLSSRFMGRTREDPL